MCIAADVRTGPEGGAPGFQWWMGEGGGGALQRSTCAEGIAEDEYVLAKGGMHQPYIPITLYQPRERLLFMQHCPPSQPYITPAFSGSQSEKESNGLHNCAILGYPE